MFTAGEIEAVLEEITPAIRQAIREFLTRLDGGLFHEILGAALVVARTIVRLLVEAVARKLDRKWSRVNPHCPRCRHRMEWKGWHQARPNTIFGVVTITRSQYWCKRCGGPCRYPLDERLGLREHICESLVRVVATLGASLPYAAASRVLRAIQGVPVCVRTCRNVTTGIARDLLRRIDERIERIMGDSSLRSRVSAAAQRVFRLYVTLDGAKVNTREGGWKEIRVAALWSETEEQARAKIKGWKARRGKRRPRKREGRGRQRPAWYVVRFRTVEDFGRAVYARAVELGVEHVEQIVVIADGAPWIWNPVATAFPTATQIIDWWHAVERLWEVARSVYGEGATGARRWVDRRKSNLMSGRADLVVRALDALSSARRLRRDAGELVRLAIGYFRENAKRMDYPSYIERGSDIGSGRVEAACKRIAGERLKCTGARWAHDNAEALATLRAEMLSGTLDVYWKQRDADLRLRAAKVAPRQARRHAA